MRKNICDLTRDFYADVTEIEDHEICGKQQIGGRLVPSMRSTVNSAATSGREVPGISPHVFLWTHTGAQGRARVGVSRMNTQEAKMSCALASYLVDCGVPRPSITLITPYKGQLMEMRNLLLKDPRCSSLKLLSRDPSESDVVRVSTIDRFQGDESDVSGLLSGHAVAEFDSLLAIKIGWQIIICSLVVDENSRTGFGKSHTAKV